MFVLQDKKIMAILLDFRPMLRLKRDNSSFLWKNASSRQIVVAFRSSSSKKLTFKLQVASFYKF